MSVAISWHSVTENNITTDGSGNYLYPPDPIPIPYLSFGVIDAAISAFSKIIVVARVQGEETTNIRLWQDEKTASGSPALFGDVYVFGNDEPFLRVNLSAFSVSGIVLDGTPSAQTSYASGSFSAMPATQSGGLALCGANGLTRDNSFNSYSYAVGIGLTAPTGGIIFSAVTYAQYEIKNFRLLSSFDTKIV